MSLATKSVSDPELQEEQLFPLTVPLGDDACADIQPQGPLGQRLLSADLIGPDELEAALIHQIEKGQKLGEALLELGFASEDQLLPFIETQLGVPGI